MTFVELLKYSKLPTSLHVSDKFIYWDAKTKEWVVKKRFNHKTDLELFRTQDEQELVKIIFAAQPVE